MRMSASSQPNRILLRCDKVKEFSPRFITHCGPFGMVSFMTIVRQNSTNFSTRKIYYIKRRKSFEKKLLYSLEYLITVLHLMNNGKLHFKLLAKKDNLMLLNNQFKTFRINLNAQHVNEVTPLCTIIRYSTVMGFWSLFCRLSYNTTKLYLILAAIKR